MPLNKETKPNQHICRHKSSYFKVLKRHGLNECGTEAYPTHFEQYLNWPVGYFEGNGGRYVFESHFYIV